MIRVSATVIGLVTTVAFGQGAPPNGIRPSDVRHDALVHCRVVGEPGSVLDDATIVMKDGWIVAVGPAASTTIPAGATTHDCTGLVAYAGFIEPYLQVDTTAQARAAASQADAHWNPRVTPQVRVRDAQLPSASTRDALRDAGFCVAAAWPSSGALRGTGAALTLAVDDAQVAWLGDDLGQLASFDRFTPPEGQEPPYDAPRAAAYPASRMGAIALLRQVLRDAAWHSDAVAASSQRPTGQERPRANAALESLRACLPRSGAGSMQLVIECNDEHAVLHARRMLDEAGWHGWCVASGLEFRELDAVIATRLPLVVPMDFAKAPDLTNPRRADQVSLRELGTWACSPMNPALLADRGVTIALTTHRLKERTDLHARLRTACEHGLGSDAALAALTTVPARLLGLEATHGRIAPGCMANVTLMDGALAGKGAQVRRVWVAGRQSIVKPQPVLPIDGGFVMTAGDRSMRGRIDLAKGSITLLKPPTEGAEAGSKPGFAKAERIELGQRTVSFVAPAGTLDPTQRVRVVGEADGTAIRLETVTPRGDRTIWVMVADATVPAGDDAAAGSTADGASAADGAKDATKEGDRDPRLPAALALLSTAPFGDAGGRCERTGQGDRKPMPVPATVLRNATVWTSAKAGILEGCDVLVDGGTVKAIGRALTVPAGTVEIDCTGRHVTPGLIDCHSHTGVLGEVNEWTQACTAEVGIGDVIDPTDINWYRQLAGGLTAANQLHGSANPIGGRNSVVKLKWGESASAFPVPDAKPGIKFALGENVVRPRDRYPDTRMGVEAYMRDRFRAAAEQRTALARWNALPAATRKATVPPYVDDELTVLGEILAGERVVHCHSYRQDEIVMLLDLADELGFRVATLQHILEGYKVADRIARHGAGASSFSDWWAYKMEVMDAVPHNGAVMAGEGVLTSFNSDSDELARRLNTEAAKACRYGGLEPAEALRFVTINPAIQLGIGHRTGSLEIGKDADLVVWSADPLSSAALCDQTWIEGVKRFDRIADRERQAQDAALRSQLLEAAFEGGSADRPPAKPEGEGGRRRGPTLLARMRGPREGAVGEMYRRGEDPAAVRSGECGCGAVMNAFGGGER
ncbi:MAG: amidohydrolase family protein [Phycisphaerales bacterium]